MNGGEDVLFIELDEYFSALMNRRSEPYFVVVAVMYGVK